MIVADTSAMLALLNSQDIHHEALLRWFDEAVDEWILPWSTLPEVDYLIGRHAGAAARRTFVEDVAAGGYLVEWGTSADLLRASEIDRQHRAMDLGLVDTTVMAVAERLKADAIATLDLRHFSAVKLRIQPLLLPRDG